MSGTNAVKAKKAVIDLLGEAFAATTVQVSYHYPGRSAERELVHGGVVTGTHGFLAMKGRRPRHARDEELVFRLHVVVSKPGDDPYDAELRCTEIGDEIENALSERFAVDAVPGLLSIRVTAVDLDSDSDDQGAIAVLTYDVACRSILDE
jgi:hypothetical protein